MKLKSFTLLELIVALAISSIVSGIIYAGYAIVGNNYRKQTAENEMIYQLNLFHSLLNRDMDESEQVKKTGEFDIQFKLSNGQIDYSFYEDYVIREANSVPDTFRLMVDEIDIGELNSQLVSEVHFTTQFGEQALEFRYQKIYAADFLMQFEDEH